MLAPLALVAAAAAQAQDDHHMSPLQTLVVNASADVARAPDLAIINAGVQTDAVTAQAAMADNARKMAAVIATLKQRGVADKDMQTSGLSLNAQYDYRQGNTPKLTGYQATNTLTLRLRKLDSAGAMLDSLVTAGVNQINGPTFDLSDPEAALDEARQKAVQMARTRADLYAAAAGLKVKRILSIAEGGAPAPQPVFLKAARMAAATPADATTELAPGEISRTATVSITFELE
ncbi:MAG: hypothetical protein C0522_15025 [Rhodocyclaceae bacterium]|nr:hypothetical protein [Rhodocyclaceae bacterium]